eukprot:PhF_6_TR29260/c1_g3_i4/m.42854
MQDSYVCVSFPTGKKYSFLSTEFFLPTKYTLTRPLASGAHGYVIAAVDTTTLKCKAIKKHTNVLARRDSVVHLLRELVTYECLPDHDSVQKAQDVYTAGDDIYTVFELMDFSLKDVILGQALQPEYCRHFIRQILLALHHLHSSGIMHRDLKPENILVNKDCSLRLADFGLVRMFTQSEAFTYYVVTRWYRPPELLLVHQEYTCVIDTWSAGCIFAELFLKQPLFRGENYYAQLALIVQTLGTQNLEDYQGILSPEALQVL